MNRFACRSGFSLLELLVTIAIIAILVGLSFPIYRTALLHADCSGCCARMRTVGGAFMLYATDNNEQLPGRVEGTGNNKWPALLQPYVPDVKTYVDPGDPVASAVSTTNLVSNAFNYGSFIFNGFNDLGGYTNPSVSVTLTSLTNATNTIILGQEVKGSGQFYMDFVEGNQDDILNKTAYFGGSNYAFADGSARYIPLAQYNDDMWLVNQSYAIPPVPPGH